MPGDPPPHPQKISVQRNAEAASCYDSVLRSRLTDDKVSSLNLPVLTL